MATSDIDEPDARRPVLIAGPTASGKSALALRIAEQSGGVIINTDSMQVYRDLHVLTARPPREEQSRVPHRLYGHIDAATNYSAGAYLADAAAVLAEARATGARPIFVGGTGLYFKALTIGLSAVPEIAAETRDPIRKRLAEAGPQALHAELAKCDPVAAARLEPRDGVRIARALEVIVQTGRPLADWHRDTPPPLLPRGSFAAVFLAPDRDELYARIDTRFERMLAAGALEEVAALRMRQLHPLLPAMKAHGVPALIRHLNGEMSLLEAAAIGKADTRHYAKRQFTWFRHQLPEFERITADGAAAGLIKDMLAS